MREVGILDEVFQRGLADNVAAGKIVRRGLRQIGKIDVLEALRMREDVSGADFGDLRFGEPGSIHRAQLVGTEADVGTDAAGLGAAIAEENCDGVVGMSGLRPDRSADFAAIDIDLDDIAGVQAGLLRLVGTYQHAIVPAKIHDRLGRFLQPAVVGAAAVVDHRIAAEDDFHHLRADAVGGRNIAALRRNRLRGKRSVGDVAVIQRLAPGGVEVALDLVLPVFANDFVARGIRRTD